MSGELSEAGMLIDENQLDGGEAGENETKAMPQVAEDNENGRLKKSLKAVWSFLGHSFLTGFLAALLGAFIAGLYQQHVAREQMIHEDAAAAENQARERLAISIIMGTQMVEIQGKLIGQAKYQGPVYVRMLENWKIDDRSLLAWQARELSLFDREFLGTYGNLILSLSEISDQIDLLKLKYGSTPERVLSESEKRDLQRIVGEGSISSGYLAQRLGKMYGSNGS